MRNGTFRTLPFFAQGMLENIGVAQAVNDMLLTSHGYGLRLFPIWAALRPDESASFATLRGKGAFLVSADYDGVTRQVGNVTIVSEAGMLCRVLSPWSGRDVMVWSAEGHEQGQPHEPSLRLSPVMGWVEFTTVNGGVYRLTPAGSLGSDSLVH